MNEKPVIAKRNPYLVELEANKKYFWCACGKSAKQPFCDGSHKGTEFKPLAFEVPESKKYALCGCKHTKNPAFCDGTHTKLDE